MFSIYVDPKRIDPEHVFDADVARYIAYFKSAKPVDGVSEVLVPGEPERAMRAERTKNGVPLSDETWGAINAAAKRVGASVPKFSIREHYGLSPVEQHAVLEVLAQRAGQHAALDVAALAHEIVRACRGARCARRPAR